MFKIIREKTMSYLRQLIVVMLVGLAIGAFAGLAEAATYYLAPDGNDDLAGDIDHPWKTLYKACQTLIAGDTVYLRAGTYPGYGSGADGPKPLNSGTAGNPITFATYPGEVAIVRPAVDYSHCGFQIKGHSYITFDGLEISHCFMGGIQFRIDHNSDHIIVKNCHIHDCENLGGHCAGIYSGNGEGAESTDCQFLNNVLHDNRGPSTNSCGIEMYDMHNTTIRGNIVYNQTGVGIWMKYRCPNNDVHQNLIYDSHHGIWVGVDSDNSDFHENIIYGCTAAFRITDSGLIVTGAKVYNNVMEGGTRGIVLYDGTREQIIYNNIISGYQYGISKAYGAVYTIAYIGHNDVYDCGTAYSEVEEGENSLQLNPEFVNPTEHDYHLQSSSPCKGTGKDGRDMGAYPGVALKGDLTGDSLINIQDIQACV
ncbi:right-handed parallel beta-helix repeat-containing protein, partial [bacterium]|nr:right-handed parallel beta-helix repeat-containing protein [bacterium]